MKNLLVLFLLSQFAFASFAQTSKEQLALNVSKAEQANMASLMQYIWKRHSNVFINNQVKLTTITEFKFDSNGKLVTTVVDSKTTVKAKPGLRGAAQKSAAEDKADYVKKALDISLNYAFMSKGELVDFFDKATITQKDGMIEAVATNVLVSGDRLLMRIDPQTNLIMYKEFSSLLGQDAISGKLLYDKFNNGTVHGTMTTLNLPVQSMRIEGSNQDYTIRVQ